MLRPAHVRRRDLLARRMDTLFALGITWGVLLAGGACQRAGAVGSSRYRTWPSVMTATSLRMSAASGGVCTLALRAISMRRGSSCSARHTRWTLLRWARAMMAGSGSMSGTSRTGTK